MGSSDGVLALVARSELGEVTVVVTLPVVEHEYTYFFVSFIPSQKQGDVHLVVENLGLARLGLGDERLVQDIEYILADALELLLDLLAVLADGLDVLLRALGLFLLLDGGDDAP